MAQEHKTAAQAGKLGKEDTVHFRFTEDQQHVVAQIYGKDRSKMEFWEVCELLDSLIDDAALRAM